MWQVVGVVIVSCSSPSSLKGACLLAWPLADSSFLEQAGKNWVCVDSFSGPHFQESFPQRWGGIPGWSIWLIGPMANIWLAEAATAAWWPAAAAVTACRLEAASNFSFWIISSLFFICFLSLARRFWNQIFTWERERMSFFKFWQFQITRQNELQACWNISIYLYLS